MDLEKAYDLMREHRILLILQEQGITGHMFQFIKNFLKNRKIQVRIGNILSETRNITNGVPQGSVISVILFLMAMNSILASIPKAIKKRLFADDLTLECSGKIDNTFKILQNGINTIKEFCNKTGFTFSLVESKT